MLCQSMKKSMSSLSSFGVIWSISRTRSTGSENNIVRSYAAPGSFLLGFVHLKHRSNFKKLKKHFATNFAFLRMVSVAGMSVLLSLDSLVVGLSGIMKTLCF